MEPLITLTFSTLLYIGLLYIGTTGGVRASMATPASAIVDFHGSGAPST